MNKQNIRLRDRLVSWLINHPWLKLITLILAILVWFYVSGEVKQIDY